MARSYVVEDRPKKKVRPNRKAKRKLETKRHAYDVMVEKMRSDRKQAFTKPGSTNQHKS